MVTKPLFCIAIISILAGCGNQQHNKETKEITDTNSVSSTAHPIEANASKSDTNNPSAVYFKAGGTEPSWGLNIAPTKITFTRIGESDFNTPHVEPIQAADSNVKLYRAAVESGSIEITIAQGECSDQMSDIRYDYTVDILFKFNDQKESKTYTGCGNYIADYRLHDIWSLEKIGEESVSATDFNKEKPYLEIISKEKSFMGFAGCNRITGTLFTEGKTLRFRAASTLMACPSGNREEDFLKALHASTTYSVEQGRLILSNPNGVQLVFRKVD